MVNDDAHNCDVMSSISVTERDAGNNPEGTLGTQRKNEGL